MYDITNDSSFFVFSKFYCYITYLLWLIHFFLIFYTIIVHFRQLLDHYLKTSEPSHICINNYYAKSWHINSSIKFFMTRKFHQKMFKYLS